MAVSARQREVVEAVFRAMQAGPAGEDAMMALFADDAVLIEPFSGTPRTHRGHAAIRESLREQHRDPLPDLRLTIERLDVDGRRLRADWTCTSPALPAPMRGYDLFTIDESDKITRLEIVVADAPEGER